MLLSLFQISTGKKIKKIKISGTKPGVASGPESREKHLQGAELGRGVSGGVGCNSSSRLSCLQPGRSTEENSCVPVFQREVRNREGRKEIPGEEPEGNPTQTSPKEIKTLQDELWNTNTAKSLPTRAWHNPEQMGWWLPLVPRLSLSPCTSGFVYLAKFLIWESSGAVLSTEAALALG